MDYPLVIGILVVFVVGFFAYQWITKRPGRDAAVKRVAPSAGMASGPVTESPKEQFPQIAGQTQAEALTKEPDQRREPSSQQAPALNNGAAPAQFDQHLRHPEQLFHQPTPPSQTTDVPSGRASETAPMGQQNGQGFHPEMAQNGGAFLGNSVFAYDGMEPTAFTSF